MKDRRLRTLFACFSLELVGFSLSYNNPACPQWPDQQEWSKLDQKLSKDASLIGPIDNSMYETYCSNEEVDEYDSICMFASACAHDFCDPDNFGYDLPAYVVDVRTEADIVAAVEFASKYDIEVSIKTSGFSLTGSSTAANSLMIWTKNFPKGGEIIKNYKNSCGESFPVVLGINGGDTREDVTHAVKHKYHVVQGSHPGLAMAGGWLQCGGMAISTRTYGLGIDQVVDARVVLADGTLVVADKCTNPDLFFAIRGNGGGSFGVVTHVTYMLHKRTPFVLLNWGIHGYQQAVKEGTLEKFYKMVEQFLEFWIKKSDTLDARWSGFFHAVGIKLYFAGTLRQAKRTFINEFDKWYKEEFDQPDYEDKEWGASLPSNSVKTFRSWFQMKLEGTGGKAAEQVKDSISPFVSSRLVPFDYLKKNPGALTELLLGLIREEELMNSSLHGGKVSEVPGDETSINPAFRKAVWNIKTRTEVGAKMVRDLLPNNITGSDFCHQGSFEEDWRVASWGDNLQRLEEIKEIYDPDNRFNPWHGPGYIGEEVPSLKVRFKRKAPIKRDCKWLEAQQKDKEWYCESFGKVKRLCRSTCGACTGCSDNSVGKFNEYKTIQKTCSWLRNKDAAGIKKTCKISPEAQSSCYETCKICP